MPTQTPTHPEPATSGAKATMEAQLEQRLRNKTAVIGVVGLGYVGLPLARAIHAKGYKVLGYDVDDAKVRMLREGKNYLKHLGSGLAKELAQTGRFEPTSDEARLREADAVILCVPTPLGAHHEPDLAYVIASTELAARQLRPGQIVVLESTTYPGTTRDEMLPILEKTGLKCGRDFFLAYSPEREDPGRLDTSTERIPKLVGGVDEASTRLAVQMYSAFIDSVHEVSSAEVAESAKLMENIYRAVNIALVNELKVVFDRLGIDIWEVVEAAKTKPFGFQAFYPGPGLGGHCIPIDPFYLTWKAKEAGYATRFIELAGEINRSMPHYVVGRVGEALNEARKSIRGSRILVLGVAYKPNVDDTRESPAAEIIEELLERGADIRYHDPHVEVFPPMRKHKIDLASVALTAEEIRAADCVLVVTDHAGVDYALVGREASLVVDTRNAMAKAGEIRGRLVKS
jgi:UDP-N-acetyl-D-glucosamine dehydrogenase